MNEVAWGALIGVSGTLIGSIVTHLLSLKTVRMQQEHERLTRTDSWSREDALSKAARRRDAYAAFIAAGDTLLITSSGFLNGISTAAALAAQSERFAAAHSAVQLLGSNAAFKASGELLEATVILGGSPREDYVDLSVKRAKACARFLEVVRSEVDSKNGP